MKLTASTIRSLTLPQGVSDRTFFDDDVPGFGVRARASGSRTFVIQYKIGGQHRRMPLGSVTEIDLGKARTTAKDLLAEVRLGRDPFAAKIEARAKAAETFGSLLPAYLQHKRAKLKPRSLVEIERHLGVQAQPFHSRAIHAIDRRAVAALLAQIKATSGPIAANRLRESLSAFFAWVIREGMLETNPAANTNREAERSRDRTLTPEELVDIWPALLDDRYGTIVKLLALTGARREEIGGLKWSEIDLERGLITLPPARTKQNREHRIPLSAAALKIIENQPRGSEFVFGYRDWAGGFSDWSQSKLALDARIAGARSASDRAEMPEWRLHDLRRTFSTMLHDDLGIEPHIVEALLGHVQGGIAAVYNRANYDGPKAAALAQWADHLLALVEGRASKVVPMKARR
jgi:integrase